MELTKKQVSITKGVAILFMLLLHLFCTKDYQGLFTPLIMIKGVPLVYYLALFGDCCVAIYCFCSGYGLMCTYKNNPDEYNKKNAKRILKLYINFWIIILLFVLLLGYLTGNSATYPGNIKTFLLNVTAISVSYNGAWWFLTTYIILVLLSKFINKVVQRSNNVLITLIVFLIYCICYVQRINVVIKFTNPVLNWAITQAALLGTSLFPFVVGAIFADKKIYSFIYNKVNSIKFKN
ncbi:MAG: acyltransferase, partial [Clostridiales bacterium]|nr:acyltransferase [Clostridiales bacterium]